MQTTDTLKHSYSIEELNARYPTKPWLATFDIKTYDYAPKPRGKRSKLTNGFMLNPFGNHPLEDPFNEKPIEPLIEKPRELKKKQTYIKKEIKKEVVKMTEKKVSGSKKEKTPEELEATRIRKRIWDDANRDRINVRRRELDKLRRIKRSQEKAAIQLLGKQALLDRNKDKTSINAPQSNTEFSCESKHDSVSNDVVTISPLPSSKKENILNTLKHVAYLIQHTSNSLINDEDSRKNVSKYRKLLESMTLSLDMVKEDIENGL